MENPPDFQDFFLSEIEKSMMPGDCIKCNIEKSIATEYDFRETTTSTTN